MDVDENGGLFEGYQLKLNSYDLGVDIELADAVQRLRFRASRREGGAAALGQEPGVLAPAPTSACWRAPPTPHKVNFLQIHQRDPQTGWRIPARIPGSALSPSSTARRPAAAMKLALATDHIILADDGSASVALPEVPLLAVLPGHRRADARGRQAQGAPRSRRLFSAPSRKASRASARCSGGWSTRSCPTAKLEAKVAERAKQFARGLEAQRQRNRHFR